VRLIKPSAVTVGDTLGLVHLTANRLTEDTVRLTHRGISYLESLGFRVKLAPHHREGSTDPKTAAGDLNAFFEDPEVDGIVALFGGSGSIRVLPFLDRAIIENSPKVVCGYSDNTSILVGLHRLTGLVTFYGPVVGGEFAEHPYVHPYTEDNFLRVIAGDLVGAVPAADYWTEEFMGNAAEDGSGARTERNVNAGYHWLREGQAEGRLIGGCLDNLIELMEEGLLPTLSGKILFWEVVFWDFNAPEHDNPPETFQEKLEALTRAKGFEDLAGMIVGRPCPSHLVARIDFPAVLERSLAGVRFPVVTGFDTGHTDPMLSLPLGVRASLDSSSNSVALLEAAVRPSTEEVV